MNNYSECYVSNTVAPVSLVSIKLVPTITKNLHYKAKSRGAPDRHLYVHVGRFILKPQPIIWSWTLLWGQNNCHSTGKDFHKILDCVGICAHSSKIAFVQHRHFNSSQRSSNGCRPTEFLYTKLIYPFPDGAQSRLTSGEPFQNCCHKVGSTQLARKS